MNEKYYKVRDELNAVSPSFCLAKWTQVTIHLQNGHTHSCHHPSTHKVPLEELAQDPSALHNTETKKSYRKMMIEGERPRECEYCWKIEDSHPDSISDRTLKSADDWAYNSLQKIASDPWDKSVNPTYLEVSFGSECNFRCSYCVPHISSAIMSEYQKMGQYKSMPQLDIGYLKALKKFPYGKDEHNPYVEAFWKWWPELSKDLKVFRITGGEPLLNQNTFKFLQALKDTPIPDLNLAINSNLGIPDVTYRKFLDEIKYVLDHKIVKSFVFYTSIDTYGKNAEFIRFGLNYETFIKNVRIFLEEIPEVEIVFMCTYNAFSVINFRKFLEEITELKNKYRNSQNHPRLVLDTPYLKDPKFLECSVLTNDFFGYIRDDVAYMKEQASKGLYSEYEINKFERILHWLENLEESEHRNNLRRALYFFINEYVFRKNIAFEDYLPEYIPFYKFCESLYMKR